MKFCLERDFRKCEIEREFIYVAKRERERERRLERIAVIIEMITKRRDEYYK